jgi:hypothetical protein
MMISPMEELGNRNRLWVHLDAPWPAGIQRSDVRNRRTVCDCLEAELTSRPAPALQEVQLPILR